MKPEKLMSMQAMRALAAWTVVTGHMVGGAIEVSGGNPFFIHFTHIVNTFYQAGVDMFFVISGTIMYIITTNLRKNAKFINIFEFVIRRATRIYPLYWLTFAFSYFVLGPFPSRSLDYSIYSLFLIDSPVIHPVAWTLIFEVRFYCIVAGVILFFSNNIFSGYILVCIVWSALVFFGSYHVIPITLMNWPLMPEFIIGLVVGALLSHRLYFASTAMITIGILWITCTAIFINLDPGTDPLYPRVLGYGVPSALMLYGVLALESKGQIQVPTFLVKAGDASYSVYLWHLCVLRILINILTGYGMLGSVLYLLISISIIAFVGHYSYVLFERPLMNLVHRRSRTVTTRSVRPG